MRPLFLSIALALGATSAVADTALLLVNGNYDRAQDMRQADALARLDRPLREAGFEVIAVEDGDVAAMRAGVEALLQANEQERVLIVVAGHVVRSGAASWLLGREAAMPSLASVDGQGVSLPVLMEIASRASGRAVVMVGLESRRLRLGDGLARGLRTGDVPQGVTVMAGSPRELAGLARDVLLEPGADLARAVARNDEVRGFGFLSSALPYLDPAPEPLPLPSSPGPSSDEQALWDAASELNTAGAFRAYLEQYPNGSYADEAEARLAELERDPLQIAEETEEAMGLSRDDRRQIQRDLSILGHDPRGIDGIFGRGTRAAIAAWQRANRVEDNGFLNAAQVAELRGQAARRAAELEEQARIEREAQERADRAFWQATGQGATEAGMRDYLARFPDGLFAEIAEARLDEIEAARRSEAEAQERADWDRVRAADTVEAYQQYLVVYPDGLFRSAAEARIDELRNPGLSPQDLAQAEAREAALNMPSITRLLVEQRLASLGLEPGRVDGTFDDDTRRAIRRFQSARGMPTTGYLDQSVVVRLLAEAIGGRVIE